MKVLTPAALTPPGGSLRLLRFAFPPFRSQPRGPSDGRFVRRCSAIGCSRLHHHPAGSPRIHAESDSCSYRLAVRLRLLPTLPRGRCSCLQLHSYDTLWRGLTPRRQSVLTDALDGRVKPGHDEGGVRHAMGNGRTNSQHYKRPGGGLPLLREAGKVDTRSAAGWGAESRMDRRAFAAKVVQFNLHRGSRPHPTWRSASPFPSKLGKAPGWRATASCRYRWSPACKHRGRWSRGPARICPASGRSRDRLPCNPSRTAVVRPGPG